MPFFKDFAWEWFNIYVKNNNRLSEVLAKQYIIKNHLAPFFCKTLLNEITSLQIEQYKAKKRNGNLNPKTINNQLSVLRKSLKTAQEWDIIKKVPKITLCKVPPQNFDFLSLNESRTLLQHADGVWHDMILVAIKTGLRLGELIALDWKDIDFDNKLLSVRSSMVYNIIGPPKSNKIRYIPLTNEVCNVLWPQRKKSGFVFSIEKNQFLKKERCCGTLRRICEKSGLRKLGWHKLRHTFASHLVEAGANIKAIQELLGHSDIQTTMRYAHLAPSSLSNTIKLLEPDININLRQYSASKVKSELDFTSLINAKESKLLANIKENRPSADLLSEM